MVLLYLKCQTCSTAGAHGHIHGDVATAIGADILGLSILFVLNDIDILVDGVLDRNDLLFTQVAETGQLLITEVDELFNTILS